MTLGKRIESVDVYRGLVMFLMMAEVLHFGRISENVTENGFWKLLAFHQDHVEWVGCSLHDLIQPSFSFLVGVALPFSILSRVRTNESKQKMWFNTIRRSLILILLGVFLRSMHQEATNWTFEDTLTQIGLGYPILFLLGFKSQKWVWASIAVILLAYWLAFFLYPLPGNDFDYQAAGVVKDWEHNLSGIAAHWNKNTNLAWAFDRWFLNLFKRETEFLFNGGGYTTLSFIPTLATMLLGLVAGNLIKSKTAVKKLIRIFTIYAMGLILAGLLLHFAGLCPVVKRIWTPTWVLVSGGLCFLLLSIFTWLIDLKNYKKPFNWLKIIGMNSIAAYILAHTIDSFIKKSFEIHLGENYAQLLAGNYQTLISGSLILIIEWLILKWMYQKNLFIRI